MLGQPFVMALLLLIGALGLPGGSARAQASPGTLPTEVRSALDRAELPQDALVAWVQPVGADGSNTAPAPPRLVWQPDQPVNPASLAKLLTTYAALDLLGPAWTWDTPVWLQGPLAGDGTLDGNLVIKGSGDPKLVLERLWLLFKHLQQFGVKRIRGDIVLDRSAFVVPEQNPADFDGEPLRPYNVGADALLLNYKALLLTFMPDVARGVARVGVDPPLAGVRLDESVPLAAPGSSGACADWRAALGAQFDDPARIRFTGTFNPACGEKTWSIAYIDPRTYNARALLGLWAEMGGTLSGTVREGAAPATPPSFVLSSPPLADIVRDINKYSNNVMAQQLFLTLALLQRGSGTPENARAVLQQWVADRLGADVAATGLVVDNGSGLSRETRVSARLLARLLQSAWGAPVMPELVASLPVNGLDGTMRRSRSPSVRAHLKTGSLRDVRGVAGYVLGDSGRRYLVVAILNHPNAGSDAARAPLAALLQWVANDAVVATSATRR